MIRPTRLVLLASVFVAAAPVPAADTAPAKPDFSSPKATVRTFYKTMGTGDIAATLACFGATTDAEKELLKDGISDDFYAIPLYVALHEKFPAEAAKVPDPQKVIESFISDLEKMEEKIDGNKATLAPPGGGGGGPASQPLSLVKIGEEWKLSVTGGRYIHAVPPADKERHNAMNEMMATAVVDVKAGKFATLAEAKKAIDERRMEVQKKFGGGGPGGPGGPPPERR